jgi:hypothetical protein
MKPRTADTLTALVTGALLGLGLVAISACTPAYVTAGAVADSLKVAVGAYEIANHTRRREILAGTDCSRVEDVNVRACYATALAEFEASRAPVAACLAAAAPLVEAAARAVEAKDAKAAATVLPSLIARAAACKVAIEESRR